MCKIAGSLFIGLISFLLGCNASKKDYREVFNNPKLYSEVTGKLTDVITYDIFTPPVASRIYAYSHLAAYEVMAHDDSSGYISLGGQLKGLEKVPAPPKGKQICYPFAATLALMQIGEALTFSKETTSAITDSLVKLAKAHGMPEEIFNNSRMYSDTVAKHILIWSKKDNYAETRSAAKYTVTGAEGKWVPTPPGYFQAVEPSWRTIRTIAMDSARQFVVDPPPPFSKDSGTVFYKMVTEVYETGKKLTEEQTAIANFWDCNGFKMNVAGHVMFATKAMTPGGHWMGITGIVAANQNADFAKTVYSFAGVAFAVMDAFIACWDMKYMYNLIRPETYINKYIDEDWRPLLQTPPFPEYTSGHSIISAAAAAVLTNIYGDNTAFRDSTERPWGWADRNFQSTKQAAKEAGISRYYGGIHYMRAIEVSADQGEKIGNLVSTKLKMKK
ncbi:MAG: vanadium-dependent haloperoxidase [Chitinophagaceae bacterium]|nr:vanadium-dependent haloperoxidase [Chitinophagaceae bacterium]